MHEKASGNMKKKLLEQRKLIQVLQSQVDNLRKTNDEIQEECIICQEPMFSGRYKNGDILKINQYEPKQLMCRHT